MTTLQRARKFAEESHLEQTYDGGSYVRNHLDRVVEVLTRFGISDPDVLAAGYLHDTLEDTGASVEDLTEVFGTHITHLVILVTDRKGRTRRERQTKTYEALSAYPNAVAVKLADRIANVEASLHACGKSFFGMYRAEHDFFRGILCDGRNHTVMWEHLNDLIATDWRVA